jgi:hypothetical protein
MGIPTPITWPISGGIASKDAPLMLQPGSHIVLDNVRQERLNEWRTRAGFTHDVNDDLPGGNPLVLGTEAPWGGFVGLTRETGLLPSGRVYNQTSLPRWTTPPVTFLPNGGGSAQTCSQITPGVWSRTSLGPTLGVPTTCTSAEGGGYRLAGWWTNGAGNGIQASLTTTAGASLFSTLQFGNFPNAIRPKAVYCSAANMLVLVFASSVGGVVSCARWSTTTGLQVGGVSTLSANGAVGTGLYLDAIYYGGATITIAFRDNVATGGLRIIEYNPATDVGTEYTPGQNCANALSLFPDPDVTGIRFVGVGSNVPEARVLRLNNVGVIQTNHLAAAVDPIQMAGVSYNAGLDWMIVYRSADGFALTCVKRINNATISAPTILGPAVAFNGLMFPVTNAWREPGTNAMRYIACVTDLIQSQPTYLEMAVDYDTSTAVISNRWSEAQARILPSAASTASIRGGLQQVQRIGVDQYVTALGRRVAFDLPADPPVIISEFAIDAVAVQYLNATTYTNQNHGPGTQTQQCAYLPAGSLLQSATGQLLCSLGASALPFQPTLVASNGAGTLTVGAAYSYVTTEHLYDEAGNVWDSEPSQAGAVSAAGMAGKNQITVTHTFTPIENTARLRTVKLWRTKGNGSAYFLVHEVTDTIANTTSVVYLDQIPDTTLAQPISAELQGTILPALSHVAMWNGRMYGIDRDFPSLLRFSKPITTGTSPIFPADFAIDISDQFGPMTGLAAMDSHLVTTKKLAIYVISGDGPDNAGNGSFPVFNRISSETGHLVGAPLVSTGREVYVVSLGGVWRVGGGQGVDFVGAAIDAYLSMPLLNSPETVTGMVVSPGLNEVRIQTTNYRFVHDRVFDVWERDTGGMAAATGIVMTRMLGGTTQVMFLASGAVWREAADTATPSDAGTSYQGRVESAWIRPNGPEGLIQLFHGRVLGQITAAGTVAQPALTVFYDNDDNLFEVFTPAGQITATAPAPIRADAQVRRQRCSTFKMRLDLPLGDALVRLDAWSASVHVWPSMQPLPVSQKWGSSVVVPAPPPPGPPLSGPTPLILKTWTVQKLANALIGDYRNKFDLLVKVKNAMIASGQWRCVSSCDGVSVSASDLWITWANLHGFPDGVYSWIILKNIAFGFEVLIRVQFNISDTEVDARLSPSGTYVGGTTTVAPAAVDDVLFGTNSWLGRQNTNQQFYAIVWTANDGSGTRVGWFCAGHLINWWQIDCLYTAGVINNAEWPTPFMAAAQGFIFDPLNGVEIAAHVLTADKFVFSGVGAYDFTKVAYIPAPGAPQAQTLIYGSRELAQDAVAHPFTPPNLAEPWSTRKLWTSPMGMFASSGGSPAQGFLGYLQDQWWTATGFNDGDTIAGGKYMIVGESINPWDGTLAPPIGATVPSVDYPATLFYGRSTL